MAHLEGRDDCLIVDPGLEPDKITAYLAERNLEPAAILITHGHSDHIGGNHALKARWPECPLIASVDDAEKLTDPEKNLSAQYGLPITSPPADQTVREGDRLDFAGFELEVLAIPGTFSRTRGLCLEGGVTDGRLRRRRVVCRKYRPLRF